MSAAVHYHYVMTLQFAGADGYSVVSESGVVAVRQGRRRSEVFADIQERAAAKYHANPDRMRGTSGNGAVLFFALEPDEMGGAS